MSVRTKSAWVVVLGLILTTSSVPAGAGSARTMDDADLEAALERAGDRRGEWEAALQRIDEARRPGLAHLISYMPSSDLEALSTEFVVQNVDLAYEARAAAAWGAAIPEDVFLNAVLPYANVNEPRDPWRREFRDRFAPVVADCETPGEAAVKLNAHVFGELGVRYSTQRKRADQSPKESIDQGMASCTGLSIVLADACRAVGVPARLAGIASWVNRSGNHTWVEVWDDGWHFTGACEPAELDRGWFQGNASLAQAGSRRHAIWAAHWARTESTMPMVWAPENDSVWAVDVTERYAPASAAPPARCRVMVNVRVESARVACAVQLRSTDEGSEIELSGVSRDEGFDTNDLLTFEVPRGRALRVTATHEGRQVSFEGETADRPQLVVELGFDAAPDPADDETLLDEARDWYAAAEDDRAELSFGPQVDERLVHDGEAMRRLAWEAYRSAPIHDETQADFEAKRVRAGGHESPYTLKKVGERPEGGWPLFIAMHGGGGVPKHVNDSQWQHMQIYYKDQPGCGYQYLALRAPTDAWNGFYTGYVYPLIEKLIRQLLLFGDVDPDKVFLMGYSHGGYGAFAIGPQLPDRFAAVHASAAAPTGGQTSALNLRNTVFTFMCGENDTAYGRIERCDAFAKQIEELKAENPGRYPVTYERMAGFGHGGLPDRDKISSMIGAVRDAAPLDLSWEPNGASRHHWWLELPEPGGGQRVEARIEDGRLSLTTQGVSRVELWLDERHVGLGEVVAVSLNGHDLSFTAQPRFSTLLASIEARGDPRLAGCARVGLAPGASEEGSGR